MYATSAAAAAEEKRLVYGRQRNGVLRPLSRGITDSHAVFTLPLHAAHGLHQTVGEVLMLVVGVYADGPCRLFLARTVVSFPSLTEIFLSALRNCGIRIAVRCCDPTGNLPSLREKSELGWMKGFSWGVTNQVQF